MDFVLKIITGRNDGCYIHVKSLEDGQLDVTLISPYAMEKLNEREIIMKIRKGECEPVQEAKINSSEFAQWIYWQQDY